MTYCYFAHWKFTKYTLHTYDYILCLYLLDNQCKKIQHFDFHMDTKQMHIHGALIRTYDRMCNGQECVFTETKKMHICSLIVLKQESTSLPWKHPRDRAPPISNLCQICPAITVICTFKVYLILFILILCFFFSFHTL